MIVSLSNEVLELIKSDLFRYGIKSFTKRILLKEILTNSIIRFIVFHRIGHFYYHRNNKLILRLLGILLKLKIVNNHNSEIPFSVDFGPGLYIGHFNGITINPKAKLGKNINLHKGVTIGQENRGKRKGVPCIGNNVYIGINSVVVGNISIGDNVLIAPNSHVNSDVPANSIVFGNPSNIKFNLNATEHYVNNLC